MPSRSAAAAAAVVTLAPCAPFGPVFAAAAAIRPICRRNTYKLYQQSQRAIFILLLLFFFSVCSCWSVMVAWVGGQLILWRRNHKGRNWFYYIIIFFSQRMYRLI